MTEHIEDRLDGNYRGRQFRQISSNSPTPTVHDASLTRRPRSLASSRLSAGVDRGRQSHKALSGLSSASIAYVKSGLEPQTSRIAPSSPTQRRDEVVPGSDLSRAKVQPSTSTVFSRTIQDLEGLLNEALDIAQLATTDHEAKTYVASPSTVEPRRTDGSDTLKLATEGLQHAGDDTASTPPRQSLPASASPTDVADQQHHFDKPHSIRPYAAAHQSRPEAKSPVAKPQLSYVLEQDWAQPWHPSRSLQPSKDGKEVNAPDPATVSLKEPVEHILRRKSSKQRLSDRIAASEHMKGYTLPPILARSTSNRLKGAKNNRDDLVIGGELDEPIRNTTNEATTSQKGLDPTSATSTGDCFQDMFGLESSHNSSRSFATKHSSDINLNGCRHVDIKGSQNLNVHHTCRHQSVARDWAISRKRFAASIACTNTALIGIIIGIYAGEVPAIQYVIVDLGHYTILGNVILYLGLAMPTLFLWPLPLMHGRKPYTIMALALALCLQIPQGIAVSDLRPPYVSTYRKMLLLSRAASGFALGFVNINLQATLLDLFGASLQSRNPHQEMVDGFDVRRHGGGMGLWLGTWSWCCVGSISVGFFVGTLIVSGADVSWGFWTSLMLILAVLLLNIIGPEVRRSAYRRTVAEVMGDEGHLSRVSRGEIKMHLKSAGPYWWGEEVKAGMELCWKMLQQPGFAVLAVYTGWAYAHFTLVLMLLGALASQHYRLKPVYVGFCVLALGGGALLATPFQKASLFSRARHHRQRTDSMTLQKSVSWSSHLVRRAVFTLLLPVAGLAYVLASRGPPISVAIPTVFAGGVGFLSNLAIAECEGIIMETFDTSDLQPGMTGRPPGRKTAKEREQRTNFSCYPRVSAGLAVTQGLSFCLAAIATGVCGRVERQLGPVQATAIVAGVLMGLTLLLTMVLVRFHVVQMIPGARSSMGNLTRTATEWEPVVLGHPSGTTRKVSILEVGKLTRWSEIRRRNRLQC